jgi:thioredoxin reductase (NADPH)
MFDIIIVGAGPAGLTAALYALRANKKVLVLEAKNYGGQIINANKIENYPGLPSISGFDFATILYNQVKNLNCEIKYETVVRIEEDKTVITNKNTYKAKAIILATGSENRKLNIKKENEFIGKGVSYCATCDGNFYKNKVVAVLGGGNTALEDALYLSNLASKVYLIHRRDVFKGEKKYIDELQKIENVKLILNSNIVSIEGNDKLEEIIIQNVEGETTTLKVDGLFIAIGQEPKNEVFSNLVSLNKQGYFLSKDGVHTDKEGIYVAGDAREKKVRQITTAVSDGTIAAITAIAEMK